MLLKEQNKGWLKARNLALALPLPLIILVLLVLLIILVHDYNYSGDTNRCRLLRRPWTSPTRRRRSPARGSRRSSAARSSAGRSVGVAATRLSVSRALALASTAGKRTTHGTRRTRRSWSASRSLDYVRERLARVDGKHVRTLQLCDRAPRERASASDRGRRRRLVRAARAGA